VLGYTVVNDVTNVDRNTVDEKSFDGNGGHGYTPIGPRIEAELDKPRPVAITVMVNGPVKADSGTLNLPRASPRASLTWPDRSLPGPATRS
jgi:2-keto-4-pentenoate hydratase/2-oxohepta-3-ene-1,7-dioic acid hydratase in catechol pathway